jgi:hypothetical protein
MFKHLAGIVVVGILSAALVTAVFLESHIKAQGISIADKQKLKEIINDLQ